MTQSIRLAAVDPNRPEVHGIAFDVSYPDAEAWVRVGTRIEGGRAELTVEGVPSTRPRGNVFDQAEYRS